MPDHHVRRVDVKAKNEAAAWEVMEAFEVKARASLLQVTPNIMDEGVSVAGNSGSNYYRADLAQARSAAADEDDTVSTISLELSAVARPGESWTWKAKVWALAMTKHKRVQITITAHSRIVAEGIASTLESHFAQRESRIPSEATEGESSPTAKESWLKRTWRDHAAALVITLIATVLASLFLVWTGLT